MQNKPRLTALPCTDLTADGEAHLLEHALSCGGYVVFDRLALEHEMVEVVELLARIDDALTLPPVIRDVVPRVN